MSLRSRRILPLHASAMPDQTGAVTAALAGCLAIAVLLALAAPPLFWLLSATAAVLAVAFLAFRHTIACSIAWLLIAGATLEMTLSDIVGPAAFQMTIAAVKATEAALILVCILRYGPRLDVFNPAFAFLAMFVTGLVHGLHPGLTLGDSLRSLAGSIIPFGFAFSRLSRRWADAIVHTTCWIPLITVTGAVVLDLAGVRPMSAESGGTRLAGLGHPAFLAGFCLAAIYACLIELYREGRWHLLALLAANFLILVLTGARSPLACAVGVTALTLTFVRSPAFPRRYRIVPLLLVACLLPLLAVLAQDLSRVRLFNILSTQAANLSGRDLLWPPFREAAAASPWFGWGVGSGNTILPPGSELARQMQTFAAHNEYLRIDVEGGWIGSSLLIGLFTLWAVQRTARLCRTDRIIMRLAFVAFAVHAYTDNVLIATTACVFFTFAAAVFARSVPDREASREPVRAPARLLNAGEVA